MRLNVRRPLDSPLICGALGVLVLLAAEEAAGRLGLFSTLQFPLASTVLVNAAELIVDPDFLMDIVATVLAWALGLLLTVVVAVPLGLLLGSVPPVERALRPLIEFMRPIPSVAIIPLASFIFSERLDMKIAMILYASTWPILINTMYGLREVDPVAKETLRTFGFSPLQVLWRVSLPSTAPFIATGIRLAATIALILAISTELLAGGSEGIGTFIILAGSSPDAVTLTIAATFWAGVLGVLANGAFVRAERRLFRWNAARAGATL
ncbi:ABC transporter permease [Nonomuraea pusilla]|uniref:NitT/TauT family transport system permease protein n=1 Tax=Nonomuraea pusilla TaxID=46177 RepID=A0A1H8JXT7_9ACTN|nr:ABC transporter permease [Nonomuraea pusilla]SEN85076.1 NitT/TauT family transport system permease protein [Nonomuraea pusilla]